MLTLIVNEAESYDESTELFIPISSFTLELEHSLVSVSKWEAEFNKSFLSTKDKTQEEVFSYIKAMMLTPKIPGEIFSKFSSEHFEAINAYIESPQSATTFGEMPKSRSRKEIITSELIYYWMVLFNIPFECQHWHLNRLLTLIRVCNMKNSKPKKVSKHETAMKYRQLNEQRRAQFNTSG